MSINNNDDDDDDENNNINFFGLVASSLHIHVDKH